MQNTKKQEDSKTNIEGDGKPLSFYKSTVKGQVVSSVVTFPSARDGHFADIYKDHLIVFGGDRHMMAFNDLYMIRLNV